MIVDVIKGFILLSLIFIPLERVFTLHNQKILRREWLTDALYYVTGFFIGRAGSVLCATIALLLASGLASSELQSRVGSQPLWLQLAAAIVVADVGYYLAHRLLHTVPWLWQFHAIHHSIEEMDWLATVRVHPVDQLFTKLFQMVPLFWLGFSVQTFAVYALLSATIAFYIHANIRLTAGPLKWIFATPEFHHWHHANQPSVRNKNLAAQLPLIDFLFGTFYLPHGQRPIRYGVSYPVPKGYFRQFIAPFQQLITRHRRNRPMTNDQPTKKPVYLRPLPLLLCLTLATGAGVVGYAKYNNYSVKTMVYVFFAGFNTPKVSLTELEQGKVKPVVLVDVRDRPEHDADHIANSVSIPLTEIKQGPGVDRLREVVKASSKSTQPTVVLYCQSGPRSIEAYQRLKATGLNLIVLSGGIKAWRQTVPAAKDEEILSPISVPVNSARAMNSKPL